MDQMGAFKMRVQIADKNITKIHRFDTHYYKTNSLLYAKSQSGVFKIKLFDKTYITITISYIHHYITSLSFIFVRETDKQLTLFIDIVTVNK